MTKRLTLTLSDDLLAHVQTAADQSGLSAETWATRVLADAFDVPGVREEATTFDAGPHGDDLLAKQTPQARAFQHAAALAALEQYDRTGEHVTLEEWAAEFRADVEARLAAR